jgi:hypothetical protein
MNIDKLAIAIQKDFDKVHAEIAEVRVEIGGMKATMGGMEATMGGMKDTMGGMATKDEFRSFKDEILKAIADLRKITEGIDARFSAYTLRTNEDISKIQGSVKDVDVRLRVVESRG